MAKKLTDKQEQFCQQYLIDLNATQACIRASYSEKTAQEMGSENLSKPIIQKRISELKAKRAEKLEVTQEEILNHLNILRSSNINEYIKFDKGVVSFKDFNKLTEEQLMCVESIKNTANGIELKLHGKEWTIEKINRHIGFYEADNSQSKPVQPPITIINDGKNVDLSM